MAIYIDDLNIQDLVGGGKFFKFIRGGLQSLPTYRGEDDIVPEASGRDPGQWIKDVREPALHGIIGGNGVSAQATRESFATRSAAVIAKMDVATLVTLTVTAPDFGLAEDEQAVLENVRPQRIVGPDPSDLGYEGWEITLEFVCIDSPPDWTIEAAS